MPMSGISRKSEASRSLRASGIDEARVKQFCKIYEVPQAFTSVDEVLSGNVVDSVPIVTPDPFHAGLSIQALKTGKHVLCEKPLATNYKDAARMVSAAKKAGTVNMVNLSYRNAPAIQKAARMVEQGMPGEIRHVHAHYLQSWLVQDGWGFWKEEPKWLWRLGVHE